MRGFRVGLVLMLAVGTLVAGVGSKAQAVIGIPDDVPAATLLYPFFKVDPTPTALSRRDSLIVITNTSALSFSSPTFAHVTIWDVTSVHVYDFTVALTPHDVFSCSLLDLLVNPSGLAKPCGTFQAPVGVPSQLTITDPTDKTKILSGYVTVDVVSGPTSLFPGQAGYPTLPWNILIGHLYLVNLPAGSSTGFNAVSIESAFPTEGQPVTQPALTSAVISASQAFTGNGNTPFPGFYYNKCISEQGATSACFDDRERIDGPNGDWAQTLTNGGFLNIVPDSPLSLLLRYFSSSDLNGRSEIWLWKDRVTSGSAASISVAVYDEDENPHSISLNLPNEVNFGSTTDVITPGVPGGWFRVKFLCGVFGSCNFGTSTSTGGVNVVDPVQAVAYSLQFADSAGSGGEQSRFLRWDAAFPAHRQYTDYIGGPSFE